MSTETEVDDNIFSYFWKIPKVSPTVTSIQTTSKKYDPLIFSRTVPSKSVPDSALVPNSSSTAVTAISSTSVAPVKIDLSRHGFGASNRGLLQVEKNDSELWKIKSNFTPKIESKLSDEAIKIINKLSQKNLRMYFFRGVDAGP